MKLHVTTLVGIAFVAGCSSSGGEPAGSPAQTAAPAPTPTPSSSPSPTPAPTPTPSATAGPTPTPTPTLTSYLTFSEVYTNRIGSGITLPSACSGFVVQSQPPPVLATTPYGQGLSFRFIITPQVWAISGEVNVPFDGRDADPSAAGTEVAYAKLVGADTVTFSIAQPAPVGAGLVYTRLAAVSAPVLGVNRLYHCVIGIPTLVADLPTAPSGAFGRNVMMATAYVREGAGSRSYSLGRSVVSMSVDLVAQRVTISLRLIGTPPTGGADLELGTFAAIAPIDAATGNFVGNLSSTGRTVTGAVSGRLFGPQAVEIGVAVGATVADAPGTPGFSVAGAAYGIR